MINLRLKTKLHNFRPGALTAGFCNCLRDARGVAMTEYILVSVVIIPVAFYLFDPSNVIYQVVRNNYDLTSLSLQFPGP